MADGADLRHCRAHHHLSLRARARRAGGADRRGEPPVPPGHHGQGRRRARAHRRGRHGGVRQDRHADPRASRKLLEDETYFRRSASRLPPGSPRRASILTRARIVAAAEQRLGTVARRIGRRGDSGRAVSSGALAQGDERLGSAEWCGRRKRRGGQRGLVSARLARRRFASASPIACRSDAGEVVAALKRQGYRLALLSGDRKAVVETDRARARHRDVARRAEARRQDRLARCSAQRRAARC